MTTTGPRAIIATLVAAGLLLVSGCTGGASDRDGSGPTREAAGGTTGAEIVPAPPTTEAPGGTEPVGPTTTLPDTPVGRYAEAVVGATTSDVAIGGSPAAMYLEYLANYTALTGRPVGHVARIDETSFLLIQTEAADVVYDSFERSDLGISNLAMDGRSLTDIVSVVSRPVRDPSGIEVLGGYAFTSYGANRIAIITVHNGTDVGMTIDPVAASWVEVTGSRQLAEAAIVGEAIQLAPGATAEVIGAFPRGDGDPRGVLEQLVVPTVAGAGADVTLSIPIGRSRPTFFTSGPDGTLRGELDADIAFATDSAEPSIDALEILFKATQEILVHDPVSGLCVAGHADSVGDEAYNLELSRARAQTVASVLADHGVTNPIEAVGYGEAFAPGDELDDPGSRRVDVSFSGCPGSPSDG